MSIAACDLCADLIDTDAHPESFVKDRCLCAHCREQLQPWELDQDEERRFIAWCEERGIYC